MTFASTQAKQNLKRLNDFERLRNRCGSVENIASQLNLKRAVYNCQLASLQNHFSDGTNPFKSELRRLVRVDVRADRILLGDLEYQATSPIFANFPGEWSNALSFVSSEGVRYSLKETQDGDLKYQLFCGRRDRVQSPSEWSIRVYYGIWGFDDFRPGYRSSYQWSNRGDQLTITHEALIDGFGPVSHFTEECRRTDQVAQDSVPWKHAAAAPTIQTPELFDHIFLTDLETIATKEGLGPLNSSDPSNVSISKRFEPEDSVSKTPVKIEGFYSKLGLLVEPFEPHFELSKLSFGTSRHPFLRPDRDHKYNIHSNQKVDLPKNLHSPKRRLFFPDITFKRNESRSAKGMKLAPDPSPEYQFVSIHLIDRTLEEPRADTQGAQPQTTPAPTPSNLTFKSEVIERILDPDDKTLPPGLRYVFQRGRASESVFRGGHSFWALLKTNLIYGPELNIRPTTSASPEPITEDLHERIAILGGSDPQQSDLVLHFFEKKFAYKPRIEPTQTPETESEQGTGTKFTIASQPKSIFGPTSSFELMTRLQAIIMKTVDQYPELLNPNSRPSSDPNSGKQNSKCIYLPTRAIFQRSGGHDHFVNRSTSRLALTLLVGKNKRDPTQEIFSTWYPTLVNPAHTQCVEGSL